MKQLAVVLAFALLPASLGAQEVGAPAVEEMAFDVGVRAGHWGWERAGANWTGALSADVRIEDRLVFDATYSVVSFCFASAEGDRCWERETAHMTTLGGRVELGSQRVRPYVGASFGYTWSGGRGSVMGARGGLVYRVTDRIGVLGDLNAHIIRVDGITTDSNGYFGALGFSLGAALRL